MGRHTLVPSETPVKMIEVAERKYSTVFRIWSPVTFGG